VVEGQLVIVSGEEDILVSCPSSTPYVEDTEESLETTFQLLEVVSNAYVKSPPVQPRSSSAALMVARVMLGHGYDPGMGLGQNSDGMASLVEFKENHGRFGLGFKPTRADVRRSALEKRGRSIFAWSYQDMPGLNPDIMQHRLPLNPGCSPVKQKIGRMKPEMPSKIKEEVKKQFDVSFLAVA